MKYRLVCLLFVCVFGTTFCLTGCKKEPEPAKPHEIVKAVPDVEVPLGDVDTDDSITDKESLLSAWQSVDHRNLVCEGNLYLDVTASVPGMDVMIPVELNLSLEQGFGMAHGNMTGKVTPPAGDVMTADTELYSDADTGMLYQNGGNGWTVSQATHGGVLGFGDVSRFSSDMFADAVYSETDTNVLLSGRLSDFGNLGRDLTSDLIQLGNAGLSGVLSDEEVAVIQDAMGNTKVIFSFERDGRLTGITLDGGFYEGVLESEHAVNVSFSGSYGFSRFGEVSMEQVQVPDTIK